MTTDGTDKGDIQSLIPAFSFQSRGMIASRVWLAVAVFFCLAKLALCDEPRDQADLLKVFRAEFVVVPPGDMKLSSNQPKRFAIAKYETTQNLYEAVMGKNPSRWKGERNSVEMVSFGNTNEFCEKVTKLLRDANLIGERENVRLPSSEEWEFAARAGTATTYSFGDDEKLLGEYAWTHDNAAGNDPPVGAKKPNPWGLYDVHGYLWEWTATRGQPDSASRIVCGGSWKDPAKGCTSASRRALPSDTRDDAVGFRCVLSSN